MVVIAGGLQCQRRTSSCAPSSNVSVGRLARPRKSNGDPCEDTAGTYSDLCSAIRRFGMICMPAQHEFGRAVSFPLHDFDEHGGALYHYRYQLNGI